MQNSILREKKCCYMEDTTQRRQNMNFTFESYKIYLTLKTKTSFSTQNKIRIFKPPRNFVFIGVYRNSEKAPDVSFV